MTSNQNVRAEKEKSILGAAYKLFKKNGFHRVGIDLIISESQAAKQTVYKYFGSKEKIILLCIANEMENNKKTITEAILQNHYENIEKLKVLFEWQIQKDISDNATECLITKAAVELWYIKEVQELVTNYQEWKYNLISELLEQLQLSEAKRKILFGVLNTLPLPSLAANHRIEWKDIKEMIDQTDKTDISVSG